MKPKVYIETTVISYLTGRASRDIIVAGHQQITQEWWINSNDRFTLVASELVVQEAKAGDKDAAKKRLKILDQITLFEISIEALELAKKLVESKAVPKRAMEDALHIAISATNGIEYLLTWNCKHIANATRRVQIEQICRKAKLGVPIICTPEELLEDKDVE
jgi:predicted nucleic acid-binding protein